VNGTFNRIQTDQLLRGLNPSRVEKRTQGGASLSYLGQADVRAHAIRMFGFGGWDCRTLDTRCVFETEKDGRWMVGYLVTMEVTIRDEYGQPVCVYSESAVGGPMGPMVSREDAHDMALKTASSDAMKRCFINLGDQFGLGLYNQGSTASIVKATLIQPRAIEAEEATQGEAVHTVNEAVAPPEPQPEVETPERVLSSDAETFLIALEAIEIQDLTPAERVLAVAKLKNGSDPAILATIAAGGISIGMLADRVAAGGAR